MTASSAMIRICVRVSVSSEFGSPMSIPRAAFRRASTLASLRAINFFGRTCHPFPAVHLNASALQLTTQPFLTAKSFLVGKPSPAPLAGVPALRHTMSGSNLGVRAGNCGVDLFPRALGLRHQSTCACRQLTWRSARKTDDERVAAGAEPHHASRSDRRRCSASRQIKRWDDRRRLTPGAHVGP